MISDQWRYFERYAYGPPLYPHIDPDENTEIIVVIPSYRETQLLHAVESLVRCEPPAFKVLVLIIVNEPENADPITTNLNEVATQQLSELKVPEFMKLVIHRAELPQKKAGVGLARKLGMDEAARWFNVLGKNGIITCYDSDCNCDPSFFKEIHKTVLHKKLDAGVIFYEHPLTNSEIIQYELFLRYHIDALRFAQYPYAFQTLGSCISVRSFTYQKSGGMNTRKAGEDFYFLHKIIPHCQFGEINGASIYPSPRESDRVPFGTGIALTKIAQLDQYLAYAPESFITMRSLFNQLEAFYENSEVILAESIKAFHQAHDFEAALNQMRDNVSSFSTFKKRFFTWWDAFRALKYVHFARDHYYSNIPLANAIKWLDEHYWKLQLTGTLEEQLLAIREWDRSYNP